MKLRNFCGMSFHFVKPSFVIQRTILAAGLLAAFPLHAAPTLIGIGSIGSATDLSGLSGTLENGVDPANVLGGIGSGLAWAGGNTFLAIPDRGPNATAWTGGASVDNTTSYISRVHTVTIDVSNTSSGSLPYTVTPTLQSTTLFSSPTALTYGAVTPSNNDASHFYFDGRSDNFGAGNSLNPNNARLDPEGIRLSNDGTKVYISDEYGPYIYEFNRATGQRTRTINLPPEFGVANLSAIGNTEITGNTIGRVANKGMEGLAITPDGTALVGFEQSPLIQDGGDGGRANRIVRIDIASGVTQEFVYDNFLADKNKNFNSSELLAINDHEFLVLERDGKGLGDGTNAVVKRLYKIDLNGATDISLLNGGAGISGEASLLPYAVSKSLFLDVKLALNSAGLTDAQIPAKLEGAAFGADIVEGATTYHTLYIANDNDFIPGTAGPNNFYVFKFTDADLGGSVFQNQSFSAVPEPACALPFGAILGLLCFLRIRKRNAALRA
ncbi:MAG: esterase-like activity of phytase family protein [Terrimicrobiaceae bacterium]|nr:esterase-like activity of phytase family protein [Terrimicrobiaceae bacterium]